MGDSTTHAELSPSKRHRWGACPGSIREEARYPEPPEGAAAIDGTRTHRILEQCINNGLKIAPEFIGSTHTDEYGSYVWDAARIDRVNVALDYIWSRVHPEGQKAIAEKRVHPDGLVNRADMSGTVDCQIPGSRVYEVIDYKDGMAPVEAKDNPQLEMYMLGVLAELPQDKLPKIMVGTIIQPKLALKGMQVISSWEIAVPDLLARVPTVIAQAAATDDPNAPLIPGESQCKYCRAKGACPAIAGKVMQEMNIVSSLFGPISPASLPATPDVAQQAANKDPGVMSAAELRQIQEAAPLVRQLLDGVDKEIRRRLEAGQKVEGFKLVRGRGSREWNLPDDEMAKKLQTMGAPKDAVYKRTLVSPAGAESLTWDKDGEVKKFSDRQIKNLQNEYITQKQGAVTVAPESDPRPAIVTDASSLFGAINVEATPVTPSPPSFFGPIPSFFGNVK